MTEALLSPANQHTSPWRWAGSQRPVKPLVSVIVVNYNGRAFLSDCLQALVEKAGREVEIIVVDNGSNDGSPSQVANLFPEVQLITSAKNLGYGAGSNLGARRARGTYLAFINPDTVTTAGWLAALVQALENDLQAGLATSKIVLLQQQEKINTAGNDIHLTGLTLCRGLGLPVKALDKPAVVGAISGAAFAIRRELFELLGGFDERFFLYMEDSDLSLRAQMAGFSCLYEPQSVIYHDYALHFGPKKCFYQERNRYLMLLKIFRWRTLLLLLPALVLAEVVTWGYVLLRDRNHWTNKLQAYGYVLRHWQGIMADRRQTQTLRHVPDRELLCTLVHNLDYGQTGLDTASHLARCCFDPFFKAWRGLLLALMRW